MHNAAANSRVRCRPAKQADAEAWDAFVDSRPEGRLGHLYGSGTLQERSYSFPAIRLIASMQAGDGSEQIHGVVQASLVKRSFGNHFFLSVPFHEYGGPIGVSAGVRSMLVDELRRTAAAMGASVVELKGVDDSQGARSATPRHFVRVRLTTKEHLYTDVFASPLRRSILKAERSNVAVERIAEWSRIQAEFLPLYRAGLRRIGGFPHRTSFFRSVWDLLGPRAQFWIASRHGLPLVAMTAYTVGRSIHVVDLVRRHAVDEFGAGDAIHWQIMQGALAQGLEVFDFGPAGAAGTRRYKLKWGGEIHQGYDVRLDAADTATVPTEATSTASSSALRSDASWRRKLSAAASAGFRHLPEPVWLALGSRIRRRMLR